MKLLSSRRNLVGVLALVVLGAGTVAGFGFFDGRSTTRADAIFGAAVGLYPGSDVQILGVPVGKVIAVKPEGKDVRVTMELDADQRAAADTGAVIVAPTLVSDRYVQLTEPYDGGAKLADGTVIGRDLTATPVEIDKLYESLNDVTVSLGPDGANKDGALSELLTVASENLDGNGKEINTMLREFGAATSTLSESDDDLFATVGNFKNFNDMLVANDKGVAQVNRQFAAVTDYLADDRHDLEKAITNLGDALVVVDDFIRDNRGNLQTSVEKLAGPTQVLVRQRESLEEMVRLLPLTLQNFTNVYNVGRNTLDGRANLNELTLWANGGGSAKSSSADSGSAASGGSLGSKTSTSSDLPLFLLPSVGDER